MGRFLESDEQPIMMTRFLLSKLHLPNQIDYYRRIPYTKEEEEKNTKNRFFGVQMRELALSKLKSIKLTINSIFFRLFIFIDVYLTTMQLHAEKWQF